MKPETKELTNRQWKYVYALVIGFLILEIVLMSLLTIHYID